MIEDYQFRFKNGEFTPLDRGILVEVEGWHEFLKENGFQLHADLGDEFAPCKIEIFSGSQVGKRWMITMMLSDTGLIEVFCDSAPDMLKYVREYCLPMLTINAQLYEKEFYQRATEVLFDPDRGLECAQRVGDFERRRATYYRAKRKEAEESAS